MQNNTRDRRIWRGRGKKITKEVEDTVASLASTQLFDSTVTSGKKRKKNDGKERTQCEKPSSNEAEHQHEEIANHHNTRLTPYQLELKNEFETTKAHVLKSLPEAYRNRFRSIVFCQWGVEYLPAIILSPYDCEPGPVRDQWMAMFNKYQENKNRQLKFLIYWYGVPWGQRNEAYSFQSKGKLISVEQGLELGFDQLPLVTQKKVQSSKKLTKREIMHMEGLKEFESDRHLDPEERAAWMRHFDEHFMLMDVPTGIHVPEHQCSLSTTYSPIEREKKASKSRLETTEQNTETFEVDEEVSVHDEDDDDYNDAEENFIVSLRATSDDIVSSSDESNHPRKSNKTKKQQTQGRKRKSSTTIKKSKAQPVVSSDVIAQYESGTEKGTNDHFDTRLDESLHIRMQFNLKAAKSVIKNLQLGQMSKPETFNNCLEKIMLHIDEVQNLTVEKEQHFQNKLNALKKQNTGYELEICELREQMHEHSTQKDSKLNYQLAHERDQFQTFLQMQKHLIHDYEQSLDRNSSQSTVASSCTSIKGSYSKGFSSPSLQSSSDNRRNGLELLTNAANSRESKVMRSNQALFASRRDESSLQPSYDDVELDSRNSYFYDDLSSSTSLEKEQNCGISNHSKRYHGNYEQTEHLSWAHRKITPSKEKESLLHATKYKKWKNDMRHR